MSSRKINYFVGFDIAVWLRLVVQHRKRITRSSLPTVLVLSLFSFINSLLKGLEQCLAGRRIAGVELPHSPIFILGHWRCGTTLLHEFFACDRRCSYPTTYQCFAPHHFLLTERLFSGPLSGVMEWAMGCRPARPQSNAIISYGSPQEDEYALTFLGAGSPYLGLMFPSHRAEFMRYRDLDALTESERQVWKDRFLFFLKKITLKNPGRRLVLKSPAHTFRIKTLLELFPDARFVHIMRDPYAVFPSTLHTFKSSFRCGALETAAEPNWEEWVFEMGLSLYGTLEQTLSLVPPGHFHEIRYEDLVTNPVEMMRMLYAQLDLDNFETALRPGLETFLTRVSQHTPNQYPLSAELRGEIGRRWKRILERYDRIQSEAWQ